MIRSYEMPETLQRLLDIDNKLIEQHDKDFDAFFGACPCFEADNGYSSTPDDAIIFLWTGADGDHFAFLTEGDTVESLEHAPIVFIQPMDSEDPVKPVANNIKDFLALYIQLQELYLFERLTYYETEEEFLNDYEDNYAEDIRENEEERAILIAAIKQAIELPKIENVFAYMQEMKKWFQQIRHRIEVARD
ncbi:hypothetical protein ACFFSY_01125 [Paenibacillus aurantiacus]|uniref:SMI1/KNR4 family protein n=1 Tax=Paenibacillus aurantiacus TaxID=1936118 RepID=A0ABV5KI34_9BACL